MIIACKESTSKQEKVKDTLHFPFFIVYLQAKSRRPVTEGVFDQLFAVNI